jgi:hypothetical protein
LFLWLEVAPCSVPTLAIPNSGTCDV